MRKENLVAGVHVLETNNGRRYFVCGGYLHGKQGGFMEMASYSDDLIYKDHSGYTVFKVYKIKTHLTFNALMDDYNLELVWERKQIPKLTEQEKNILRCLLSKYKYIARDTGVNELWVYDTKPEKSEYGEYYIPLGRSSEISIFNHLFTEITPKNSPILIEDLLHD